MHHSDGRIDMFDQSHKQQTLAKCGKKNVPPPTSSGQNCNDVDLLSYIFNKIYFIEENKFLSGSDQENFFLIELGTSTAGLKIFMVLKVIKY